MVDCPLAGVLTTAAATLAEPRLARLAQDLTAPVRIGVRGASTAAVATVVRALQAAGLWVCAPGDTPELEVGLNSGTWTPRDGRPDVALLEGSPAKAVARCAQLRRDTGVPTVALAATAALVALDPVRLDDEVFAALQDLAAGPARPVPVLQVRLDSFALANAVAAVRAGADRTAVRAVLRRVSGIEGVRAEIDRAAAGARYRRIDAVLRELAGLAAGPDGAPLARLLAGDEVVLARMTAAADVVSAAGLAPRVQGDPVREAIRWRRYARGPVSELHRSCGADLSRGALRLPAPVRPAGPVDPATVRPTAPPVTGRAARIRLQQSRVESSAAIRAACLGLRTELQADAADLDRVEDFVRHARRQVARVAAELDPDLRRLPVAPLLRPPGLESRLASVLGVTLGAGAALTLGRVAADLVPGWGAAVAAGCALAGMALGLWVIRARRLLAERAAADRWIAETVGALRSALEERAAARILAAEVTLLTSEPFRGCPPS